MKAGKHYIVRCEECNKVITQCRCPSTKKNLSHGVCDECKSVNKNELLDLEPLMNWGRWGTDAFNADEAFPLVVNDLNKAIQEIERLREVKEQYKKHFKFQFDKAERLEKNKTIPRCGSCPNFRIAKMAFNAGERGACDYWDDCGADTRLPLDGSGSCHNHPDWSEVSAGDSEDYGGA